MHLFTISEHYFISIFFITVRINMLLTLMSISFRMFHLKNAAVVLLYRSILFYYIHLGLLFLPSKRENPNSQTQALGSLIVLFFMIRVYLKIGMMYLFGTLTPRESNWLFILDACFLAHSISVAY